MISLLTFKRSGSVCCVAVCALLAMIYPATGVPIDRVANHANTLDPSSPPLKKGGQGGFFISDFRSSDQGKSPSIPLFQRGMQTQPQLPDSLQSRDMSKTRSMCVELVSDAGVQRSVPIRLGSTLRLSFRHSIYGNRVEEVFRLRADGFHLTKLRYAERRLVEFYGYEDAVSEDGMWIVRPRPAVIPSLSLRTSSDASLSLFLDYEKPSIQLDMPTDSALRLTIAHCKVARNG
jgi:hypothetical protein